MRKTSRKRYNKINRRKIFVLICLIMLVIFEIVAFRNSRANKILEITASIIDDAENIGTEQIRLEATNLGASGYSLVLPEYINNIKVDSYIIKQKEMHKDDSKEQESIEKEEIEEGNVINNVQENIIEENPLENNEIETNIETEILNKEIETNVQVDEGVQNIVQEENSSVATIESKAEEIELSESTITKIPGDTIYLTDDEVESKQIELRVLYNTYQKNGQTLYNQKIQKEVDDNGDGTADSNIKIEGFMPLNSTVEATIVNIEEIEQKITNVLSDKISFKKAYDIKILYNDQEYEPTDFDTNVKVTISGVDSINEEKQKYKVVHIDDTNNVKEVEGVKTTDNTISFPADSFSTYALLLEEDISAISLYSADLTKASIWDGTVATAFRFGDGTEGSPYLIASAAELAYIASQVNNGNNYAGTYFELIVDIDLNSIEWTPIGNYNNPFQGIFNGAGHTVANTTISLPTATPTAITSYGLFGSIGDGNSKTIIKNLQLDEINIEINANGQTANNTNDKGYNIGIVTGTIFNNAEIKNVIVNNSNITDNYTMQIRNNSVQVFVGGIAGFAVNSRNSTADPGANSRYAIENCYSNTDINLDIIPPNSGDISTLAQYAVGGIIGAIRSQPIWPENCLYTGNINATNAFTGPIFGYLRNNTGLGSKNNFSTQFNTLWQGNDAGTLTSSSYYTSYSTNNRAFTTSVPSGNSTSRVSTNTGNIGYVQGVNKGIYINSAENMLANFNNYVANNSSDRYLNWYYEASSEAFYFTPELTANVEKNIPEYKIVVNDKALTGTYTYNWYVDGALNPDITGNSTTIEPSWTDEHSIEVLVSNGYSHSLVNFVIQKLELHISFDMNNQTKILTAKLEGTGLEDPNFNFDDYTYQWYEQDIAESNEILEGETSNSITGLENDMDYKFVAENTKYPYMSVEGIYANADRTVIYCSYNIGNDANDGFTPQTPVRTLSTAYEKFDIGTTRNENVIVLMGNYTETTYLNSATSNTYSKNVTITGKYHGTDYNASLYFRANTAYKYLTADTTFMHLRFDGAGDQAYFYLQGYSITMGEGVIMQNYATSNTNQGLIAGNSPAFHMFAGWLQYDETKLPRTDAKILIKSGTYGRILLGGSSGTSSAASITKYNSHNFIGTSLTDDVYKSEITIDIQNSTTPANYTYDVNLLGGGSTCGNIYGDIKINVKNGNVGRLLGASIGDSSYRPTNWQYPINTFIGTATINMTGGAVTEMYGGCLGRNMQAIGGSLNPILCDSYFYGTVNINISGGTVSQTIYGAGAGGVSGYSANSTDAYKSYGQGIDTVVNINILGGTIDADIYGGGYGYTNYLTAASTQVDGGTLYGDSNINISGSPTINGSIYGGGRGYNLATNKPDLAQMEGKSKITISGTPTITGNIYGTGMGLTQYANMAKFTGEATININSNLNTNVFGGGNIAPTVGSTYININSGNHTADIYGGGNVGILDGTSNVIINGGTSNNVFGGGNRANTTTSNVIVNNGRITNVFGGANQADVTTTYVAVKGGSIEDAFGGSNQSGTVNESNVALEGYQDTNDGFKIFGGNNKGGQTTTSNININSGSAYAVYGGNNEGGQTITSNVNVNGGEVSEVYGGNNLGGTTITSNVNVSDGKVTDVYGGGNKAITNTPNVTVNNNANIEGSVYGGGNQAGIENNTNVDILGGNIDGNVYGGGNEGTVTGNTYVHVKDASLKDSLYAGGNGTTAIVYGNANITVDGTNTNITGSVFGGGNQAETGTKIANNSLSTVNIVGGNIGKNVYGGANTSVVYGNTLTNIGYDSVGDTSLTIGDIVIGGTVFGGGEANASGSEVYDFSFISVTVGIDININGKGHNKCQIKGSIFGSGNASSTSGYSYINIKDYGSVYAPQSNISIQRANVVTFDNSAMTLSGAKDRTNEYSNEFFTLSRIDDLKLKNGSILYLNYGANLLKKLESLVDENGQEVKAEVKIDEETGKTIRNVDNRIYMAEGKNLNIATNEQVTAYGEVVRNDFFGLFTNTMSPSTSTGLYNREYNNGDEIINAGTFSSNSYVRGLHKADHDIMIDGFYSNYEEEENPGIIRTKYIDVTPPDDVYYIWLVGVQMDVTTFEMALTASKYATLGTYELALTGFSAPNTKFVLNGFSAGLLDGISLIQPNKIENIEQDQEKANSVFGLSMKTGHNGWMTNSATTFLTENGGTYTGTNTYNSDNSAYTPTLNFCLYHSENIDKAQNLGSVKIRFQAQVPIDDLNYEISYIDINITLSSALYQNDFFEAAITPGEQFDLFTTTETNITDSSKFSTYYSLFIPEFSRSDYYTQYSVCKHVLVSRLPTGESYVFPKNTKITMLDMVTNQYYYYVVTEKDEAEGKYVYDLSDFVVMGSDTIHYDKNYAFFEYYNAGKDLLYEKFIFHIDFEENIIESNLSNNTLLMELRNAEEQTLIGVLGIQRDALVYSVYKDKDATINVNAETDKRTVYLGDKFNLTVTTEFTQDVINSKTVYDTQYFDKKMGIKISIYDSSGNRLNSDTLLGVSFTLNGIKYYPRIDGTVRINTAEKVSNVLSKITVDTSNNTVIATGDYTIKVESFGSPDGIYYGIKSSDMAEVKIMIIESSYGLKVSTTDEQKIIEKDTGFTQNNNNRLIIDIEYSSGLEKPSIATSLYRRDYSSIYSQKYDLVDLNDYLIYPLTATENESEYIISTNPSATIRYFMDLKQNLMTGTYKLVFKLYDDNEYIGEAYEYFIIK